MTSGPTNPTSDAPSSSRNVFRVLLVLAIVLAGANLLMWLGEGEPPDVKLADAKAPKPYTPLAPTFEGSSAKLSRTVVVPTLESPIPQGKSAIWCASLLLAWRQLEKDVFKGPLILLEVEELCRRLTNAPRPDIRPEDYYAAAGFAKDGISDRIHRELPLRFPSAPGPAWGPDTKGPDVLAYAYLEVALKFSHAFVELTGTVQFHEEGTTQGSEISTFGIPEDAGANAYREQVRVLFDTAGEFAVDLDRHSKPYQIVLARLNRPATLQKGLETLKEKSNRGEGGQVSLGEETALLVPYMHWALEHDFPELSDKKVRQPLLPGITNDVYTGNVTQTVRFRLDSSGAAVASGVPVPASWNGHPKLMFDGPFLIVFKTRDQDQPFFAFWVANVELLQH